jgi:hypothetical protein
MSYPQKPLVSIEEGDYRPFVAWHLSSSHALFAVVEDGALVLADNRTKTFDEYEVKPKHLRKFARALLALADEVDPPAPKVEYFGATQDLFYRQRAGKHLELWLGEWVLSAHPTIEAQQLEMGDDDSWPITAAELPEGAR